MAFKEQYRCYSMVFSTKDSEEIKHGGKIIMPPSALEKLARLNIRSASSSTRLFLYRARW